MQVNAGVAYDYFFKEHPRYFFSWLRLSSKSAQHWAHLSDSSLDIAKNVSKVAEYCQYGFDIPAAFYSFKEVLEHYQRRTDAGMCSRVTVCIEDFRILSSAKSSMWG